MCQTNKRTNCHCADNSIVLDTISSTDDVRAWFAYYFPRDVAITDSLRVLALQGIQLIYGWIQYFFSGALWERLLEWTRRARGGSGNDNSLLADAADRRRNQTKEPVPELELIPILPGSVIVADLQPQQQRTRTRQKPRFAHAQINTTALEATFLNEEDYPASWMVYHRVLGVVKKTEAEEYDLKIEEKQEQSQEESMEKKDDSDDDHEGEEKKDESQGPEIDDEKTVHHSNVSIRRENSASPTQDDSSSSSSNNDDSHSAGYPVLHSIAASG